MQNAQSKGKFELVAKTFQQHEANRASLLESTKAVLIVDKDVVASWLTGSLASRESDAFSDIDISVVLRPSEQLANHARILTTKIAKPVNIHEAPQNAPAGGTMLSVLYENGITVDWTFMSENIAVRPSDSLLLFENSEIKTGDITSAGETVPEQLENRISYFWMMAAVTAKAVLRKDAEKAEIFLSMLRAIAQEITFAVDPEREFLIREVSKSQRSTDRDKLIDICTDVLDQTAKSETAFDTILGLLDLTQRSA